MGDLRSFLQRAKQPRYTIPERVRTHPTEASAVPPDTTLSPRPFPSGPTALGLRSFPPRPTQPPPRTAGKIRLVRKSGDPENIVRPGNPPQPENPPRPENPSARNIVRPENLPQPEIRRPGTSFARKIRQPDSRSSSLLPARPSFHPTPVLSAFVPHRSPSPARFTSLSPRRNTRRASPLPPNGMPQEPRRSRPHTNPQAGPGPRQKERQPAGAAALRQSDSGPIICC